MATRAVRVRKSQNQEDLKTHREHCSADARALSALGITVLPAGAGQTKR